MLKRLAKRLANPLRHWGRRFVNDPDWVDRESMVYKAGFIIAADTIEGDYLEFGVLAGNSFIKAFRAIQQANKELTTRTDTIGVTLEDEKRRNALWESRRFFAFDSFEGLPEIGGLDKHGTEFTKGKYVSSLSRFQNNVLNAGVPEARTKIVKGWFNETLTQATIDQHNLKHAAIVYIDSDLYESAKSALNFIKPLIVDGSIIMFDEWFGFRGNPEFGERKAFKEFVDEMPGWVFTEFQKEHARRCSFIANKRNVASNGLGSA
jgi:O-methyltransferase